MIRKGLLFLTAFCWPTYGPTLVSWWLSGTTIVCCRNDYQGLNSVFNSTESRRKLTGIFGSSCFDYIWPRRVYSCHIHV